ncbi:MAG TPA: putative sulfate exporter family transporter [Tissierellales bacterium]|nr:putative sulfate exporter family transporter [Tissierellales bacterium]
MSNKEATHMGNKRLQAIIVCVLIAILATYLAGLQNVIGGPMIGLLIGMLIVNVIPRWDDEFRAGTSFVGKKFLNLGIILAGATLNFNEVIGYGAKALPLIIFNICLSFAVARLIGKKLEVTNNTSTLVGGGTSICGGTAIATISSIIEAKEKEIAYAMTAIFLFDVLGAILYPYLAGAINLTANQFGILAGTAINDTSSVAAAEATYNLLHGADFNTAITVKLARTTMLIPLALIITTIKVRKKSKENVNGVEEKSIGRTVLDVFPWFILTFLIMAILNTFNVFSIIPGADKFFSKSYKFLITAALAGVGFKIQFKDLFTEGVKPMILGGCTWVSLFISSMLFIHLFANSIG